MWSREETHGVLIAWQIGHPCFILLFQDLVLRWDDAAGEREVDREDNDGAVDGARGLSSELLRDWVWLLGERLAVASNLSGSERSNQGKG